MPALGTQAVPDKVMTLDLADLSALQSASASAAAATDFAEPENPWAPSAPPSPSAATTARAVSTPQGNPWAKIAASRTAVEPSVPVEVARKMLSGSASAAPVPAPSGSAGASPPQRQCFTNAEGVKICYMEDERHGNVTDVHKEGGVNDYHNKASSSQKEAIQGHIPGTNVTATLDNLGSNPPPNEHKDGNTAFQGQNQAEIEVQHDNHKDNSTFTDHTKTNADGSADWRSASKGPDGSKAMAEVNKTFHGQGESDTRVDKQGRDKLDTAESQGSDDHRFMSDKPGTKDDSSLVWDEDWQASQRKEEFAGKSVYDLHEESNSERKVQAKVEGDQGWGESEKGMGEFDAWFEEEKGWKEKLRDPRAGASTEAGLVAAAPTAAATMPGGAWKRDVLTTILVDGEAILLPADLAESESLAVQKRDDLDSTTSKCEHGESQWHCACRLGRARAYPCVAIFGVARPSMEQGPERVKGDVDLSARGEDPWSLAWSDFKDEHDANEEDKQAAKQWKEDKKGTSDRSELNDGPGPMPKPVDGRKRDTKDEPEDIGRSNINEGPGPMPWPVDGKKRSVTHFDSLPLPVIESRAVVSLPINSGGREDHSHRNDDKAGDAMYKVFFAFGIVMLVAVLAIGGLMVRMRVKSCLRRRRERLHRRAVVREVEGVGVVEMPFSGRM